MGLITFIEPDKDIAFVLDVCDGAVFFNHPLGSFYCYVFIWFNKRVARLSN